ncbi:cupin domain-containing protein [Jannaschia sp. S6380]|uniref:cupin domain-containing protein n=1 Tax=Jannaschia sp. S6380 TaxID=2926408 RepID=UPI001FF115FC|nr:cupin domain-containing protein [Jannaschia sp. S6380]MCK0166420.1 cupin domain-containing protein [Jannaschia sp. S6380]
MTAERIIDHLRLTPHPEGGWYRQTWAGPSGPGGRPVGTAIHFLLRAGERSHWHRVDATEIWFWQAGAPLILSQAADAAGPVRSTTLGGDPLNHALQGTVPAGHWQTARGTGDWTLVSCTVTPGFTFDGFELADPDFDIPT